MRRRPPTKYHQRELHLESDLRLRDQNIRDLEADVEKQREQIRRLQQEMDEEKQRAEEDIRVVRQERDHALTNVQSRTVGAAGQQLTEILTSAQDRIQPEPRPTFLSPPTPRDPGDPR